MATEFSCGKKGVSYFLHSESSGKNKKRYKLYEKKMPNGNEKIKCIPESALPFLKTLSKADAIVLCEKLMDGNFCDLPHNAEHSG